MRKKIAVVVLFCVALFLNMMAVLSHGGYAEATSKKKKESISLTNAAVKVGKKLSLKINNASKKVKWSVSHPQAMKMIKKKGKKNEKAVFFAKKVKHVTIKARVGKKVYRCNVTIISGKVVLKLWHDKIRNRVAYDIYNRTNKDIKYSADFSLLKYENNKWVEIPKKENVVVPKITRKLKANSKCTEMEYIDWCYDSLTPGKYKISKNGIGESSEFTITNCEDVSVTVKFDAADSRKMTLTVFNGTDTLISINPYRHGLQKFSNNVWKDVKYKRNDLKYPAIMKTLEPGEEWSEEIQLDKEYKNITPGQYAIDVLGAKRAFFTIQ